MKLYAQVKLSEVKDAQDMVRAFFNQFDPESSIHIKGDEAKIVFYFKDSPKEMAEVLSRCEIAELIYGNPNLKTDETPEKKIPKAKESNTSPRAEKRKKVEIKELDEIAEDSNSYEDFISRVGNWLDMQSLQPTFEEIVRASFSINHLSWNPIKELLDERGYTFDKKIKVEIHNKVIAKLGKYFNRTLSALQTLKDYENYPFGQKEKNGPTSKEHLSMDCMPYIEEFDKALQETRLFSSGQEKVNHILSQMGIDGEDDDKKALIISTANVVCNQEVSSSQLLEVLTIFKEQNEEKYMTFSTFLNNYLKNKGVNNPVKAVDFLIDLRKVVIEGEEKI